jgi:hypothetical protein
VRADHRLADQPAHHFNKKHRVLLSVRDAARASFQGRAVQVAVNAQGHEEAEAWGSLPVHDGSVPRVTAALGLTA